MRLDSPPTRSAAPASPAAPGPSAVPRRARAAVVVPIRSFAGGGERLATTLSAEARTTLAQRMAQRVVRAAGALPVVVVSSAPDVGAWARLQGCSVLPDPGSLDAAVRAGHEWCAAHGFARVVVAHADLALAPPGGLERFAADAGRDVVAIVPCHRDDGTPVLTVPARPDFPFAYGPGSFRRHVRLAHERGSGVRVTRDRALAFDLDLPEDLARLGEAELLR